MRRLVRLTATFVGALVMVSACANGSTATNKPKPDTLVMDLGADMSGPKIDPATSPGGLTTEFLFNVYDGLFKFDRTGNTVPGLATQDVISADGVTHTLTIRDNVLFHDGTTLTAEDVKFSLDRVRGVDPTLPNPAGKSYAASIDTVTVADPKTVVLKLKYPDPILHNELAYQAGMVVPKAAVTKAGTAEFDKSPIGTGPYKFVGQTLGQNLKFQAWDKYWGPAKPSIKNVTFQVVVDQAARIAQIQAGDADFVLDADPSQVDSMKKSGLTVIANPSGENLWILFRHDMAKLSDPRVGQALNMAVDRASMIKNIYLGTASLISSLDNSTATIDPNLKPYPYDPNKAKQLLQDAGFDFNQTLDLHVPTGRYLKDDDDALAIQSDLGKIGVKVHIVTQDYATWLNDYTSRKFGAMTFSNVPNTVYDPIPILQVVTACQKVFSYWCDPELERRYTALNSLSGKARTDAIRELDRYVHDNPPGIFLLAFQQINAMKSTIQWTQNPGTRVIYLTDISYK